MADLEQRYPGLCIDRATIDQAKPAGALMIETNEEAISIRVYGQGFWRTISRTMTPAERKASRPLP